MQKYLVEVYPKLLFNEWYIFMQYEKNMNVFNTIKLIYSLWNLNKVLTTTKSYFIWQIKTQIKNIKLV